MADDTMKPGVEIVSIEGSELRAGISNLGAELVSLQDANGNDYLWTGDPAWWASHAPILFPIVGEVSGGVLRVENKSYPIGRHGFARKSIFEILEVERSRCCFRLVSSEETREQYPFEFELYLDYEIIERKLHIRAKVLNCGDAAMPVSFGFHPAFRWPLVVGTPKEAYAISFDQAEDRPIRRLSSGLLSEAAVPSPVHHKLLSLRDAIFANDALIFDRLKSRRVTYGASSGPSIDVRFDGMPHLGIWAKPGADFVCIEPWQGFSSPVGFDGELRDKPGIVLLDVGASRYFEIGIELSHRGSAR